MMPLLQDNKEIPAEMTQANQRRDYTMVTLNLLPALGMLVSRSGWLYQAHAYYTTGRWDPDRR